MNFPKEPPLEELQRAYAVGDIHGRYDLFKRLMNRIAYDQSTRPPAATRIILLGNIVGHGSQSAKLVKGCMKMQSYGARFTVLKGNHEDMMCEALSGNLTVFSHWLHYGGRETLLSWGVGSEVADGPATLRNLDFARRVVGEEVIEWLSDLPLYDRYQEYLLVHAGIRPGKAISDQDPDDLLWIQEDFLESDACHGLTVVHGHSYTGGLPDVRSNRIGIDTGAYRTGRLTALGIENGRVWPIDTIV